MAIFLVQMSYGTISFSFIIPVSVYCTVLPSFLVLSPISTIVIFKTSNLVVGFQDQQKIVDILIWQATLYIAKEKYFLN